MGHGVHTLACIHVAGMGRGGGAAALVMFEVGAWLPKIGGRNFLGYGDTEGKGCEPMLPLARDGATSSFQAPAPWEGSVEMQAPKDAKGGLKFWPKQGAPPLCLP